MIELERKQGYPFVIAYLFTRKGTQKLCGDLNSIGNYTSKWHTCHGIVHYYNRGISELVEEHGRDSIERLCRIRLSRKVQNGIILRRWMLFGKNTISSYSHRLDGRFHLHYLNPNEKIYLHYEQDLQKRLQLKRPKYVLYWVEGNKEEKILGTWRKLPSTFLRQLAKG